MDQSFQNATSVRVTVETEGSESEEADASSAPTSPAEKITSYQFRRLQAENNRLQVELQECQLRLAEERNTRLKSSSRLVELELENEHLRRMNQYLSEAQLSTSALDDERVLDSIESSFHKFHAFLDLLKDAGLGQFVSMAGIDQSDFGLLDRPQLTSTQRSQRHEERSAMADTPQPESAPPADTEDLPRPRSRQDVPTPARSSGASPLELEAGGGSISGSSVHSALNSDSHRAQHSLLSS